MARKKNDGRGRLGGRAKGTPNKATADLREWVRNIIDDNREQIEKDVKCLDPEKRLQFIEKLLKYVLPPTLTEAITPSLNVGEELKIGFCDKDGNIIPVKV
ncbi:MAG: hypothetical protein HDS42_06755 [Bacteroides sp.]|nr:hypothetical protein [Bacteroides sp.]